jgi:hypothetical protein
MGFSICFPFRVYLHYKVFQKNPLFMAKNLMLKGEDEAAVRLLENDTEKRLDAVRTLNSLVAALSVNDGDYYDAIDIAFEEIRE